MKKISEIERLLVKYNERTVGYLLSLGEEISFQYDDDWLIDGFSISPFSLPLKKGVFTNKKRNFDGLYGVFADSLPDGWGALLMIKRLAKEGINYEGLSPLSKLSLLGDKAKGGLRYEPSQSEEKESFDDLDEIGALAKEVLEDKVIDEGKLDQMVPMMGSSGGARPKAYIRMDGKEWIVKFPGHNDRMNVGKDEYSANLLARECGLNVNEFRLFPSSVCEGYFGAARFDREKGRRIHMVSLSSLLETSFRLPNLDYLHLFKVIRAISLEEEDLYEAYGRMCFNVLFGNMDDHGNNFSFLYDEEKKSYRLSPFYDITRTPYMGEHTMTVLGKGNPEEQDLREIGGEIKLDHARCQKILEKVKNILGK